MCVCGCVCGCVLVCVSVCVWLWSVCVLVCVDGRRIVNTFNKLQAYLASCKKVAQLLIELECKQPLHMTSGWLHSLHPPTHDPATKPSPLSVCFHSYIINTAADATADGVLCLWTTKERWGWRGGLTPRTGTHLSRLTIPPNARRRSCGGG